MLTGIDKNGNIRNVIVNEDGSLPIKTTGNAAVEVVQTSDQESVLRSTIEMLSTTAETINVGKKVTVISIANFSDEEDVTMTIGTKVYQIATGLAIDFPINDTIDSFTLVSTGADTKTQLIIKGVE